jgi:hypothetical protein
VRELEQANRQLVMLLEKRKALRDERYEHTPEEYARLVNALQQDVDTAIARIQALHQLVKNIRD